MNVAVVGSGPAGLMAADVIAHAGHRVTMFEKRPGPARKLFIAGSSGLNISNSLPLDAFASHYSGGGDVFWRDLLEEFSPKRWLDFIEEELELKTFEGTSGRYFVETMHAAAMIRAWRRRLSDRGVVWVFDRECVDFDGTKLRFASGEPFAADAVCFALGGASYEPEETPLRWPAMFTSKDLAFVPFSAANVGYEVAWTEAFVKEADGVPIKNVRLTTARGSRVGDLVVTSYGLEGTPVYFVGVPGPATLDLKPDLNETKVLARLSAGLENLAPIRRAKKSLKLCPGALALLFHMAPSEGRDDLSAYAKLIKAFPLTLSRARPLVEAISTKGGLSFAELDVTLMLKKFPGVFAAGEMLDWDAPTGGFLLQACAGMGYRAGTSAVAWLAKR